MLPPTFKIMVKPKDGEAFEAFVWCLDERSGIARAWKEAPKFGHDVERVWAVPIQ